jgi:hypothetical protein
MRTLLMWKPLSDRGALVLYSALIAIGALERANLLFSFAFTHVGIDDALLWQVTTDYGNGVFREPYLYGQNYNPMLEALLSAPFVRLGAAPWLVLPLVTSMLALLPFWSWSMWALRKKYVVSALLLAAMPLLLPTEWGMVTSMPRGWVHGLAVLALVPWLLGIQHVRWRHGSIVFALVTALLMNPNTLPLVTGMGVWLLLREGHMRSLWIAGSSALAFGFMVLTAAANWYAARPGSVVHPLLPSDMVFDTALLLKGLSALDDHFRNVHPLGSIWVALVAVIACALILWRKKDRPSALGIICAVVILLLPLALPKAHEGCGSIFFPLSRMVLCFPLLLAVPGALVLRNTRMQGAHLLVLLPCAALVVIKSAGTSATTARELEQQQCAWVREEPLQKIRAQCRALREVAERHACDLVVPIRWPSIKVHHATHFTAHFTCYACPPLEPTLPPVFGAGYDRRSWIRAAHEKAPQGRVLFVGGSPVAWMHAKANLPEIEDVSTDTLQLHIVRCDTRTVAEFILHIGVDDELER